ncbi:MAG: hypothetical protein EOP45_16920 [Sphingobacteriaceae bacterium]|nr:MAG: hypothetical protein EOP45_16920 [Sphingobacteriaceae bacterium]
MSKKTHHSVINANGIMLISHGRQEITSREQLEKYSLGSLISYETVDGRYTKGGFITKFTDKYFVYTLLDFSKKYRIRYHKIKRMWVGDMFNVNNDFMSFREPDKKTKHEVKIGNYVVKCFKDKQSRLIFLGRDKYQHMLKWYDMFNNHHN